MGQRCSGRFIDRQTWLVVLVGVVVGFLALGGYPASTVTAVGEGTFTLSSQYYEGTEGTAIEVTVVRTGGGTLTQDVVATLELVNHDVGVDVPAAAVTTLVEFKAGTNLASKSVRIQTLNQNRVAHREIGVKILSVSAGGGIGTPNQATIRLKGFSAPSIDNIAPRSAGPGAVLQVTGVNFNVVNSVEFAPINGGAGPNGPFLVHNFTSMTVTVPDLVLSEGQEYRLKINITAGIPPEVGFNSPDILGNRDVFRYTTGPTVTQLSVYSGPATGGTKVRIFGTQFAGAPGQNCAGVVDSVTFGGVPATGCTFVFPNAIEVTAPAHAVGPVDVIVTAGGFPSVATADSRFTYTGGPVITNISPAFGPPSGGNTVIITGTGFSTGFQAPTAVMFGGNAASFQAQGDTTIIATAPPGAGLQKVQVIHPIGGPSSTATTASNYTYNSGPLINSISPGVGPVVGGTVVTITGSGFQPGAVVKFGAIPATFVIVDGATQIRATAPAASGTVQITVEVAGVPSPQTPAAQFSYAGPSVTAVSPIAGPLAGGTTVIITGTNFSLPSTVYLGATTVPNTYISPTQLSIVTPAVTASAELHITVQSLSGRSAESPADVFTYTNGPIVDAVNPNTGPTSGGSIVVVTGKNFTPGVVVRFGDVVVDSMNVNNATQLTVLSPPSATASAVDVRVTKAGDVSPAGPQSKFTYTSSAPTVASLAPNSGTTFGATAVTITGVGFSGASCPGSVKFGTIQAQTCTVINDTVITTVSPPNVAGPTVVTVTTPNGTSEIVQNYTYTRPDGAAPGDPTTPPAPGPGGTAAYILSQRWTLLTWGGKDTMPVADAIRGVGIPGAIDLTYRIGAVYQWDPAAMGWKGYFTGSDGVPGAIDFNLLAKGGIYWVAITGEGDATWVVAQD